VSPGVLKVGARDSKKIPTSPASLGKLDVSEDYAII